MNKETVRIIDKYGFEPEIEMDHNPYFGYSTVSYNGDIIGSIERGKIHPINSEDDAEWERH